MIDPAGARYTRFPFILFVDRRNEQVDASYVLGCDGAHSTVRKLAGGAGPS
jgi:2-polyprenyl-6-methoxyphenol hydroxylase-like FAD-dependent oxidoreductase